MRLCSLCFVAGNKLENDFRDKNFPFSKPYIKLKINLHKTLRIKTARLKPIILRACFSFLVFQFGGFVLMSSLMRLPLGVFGQHHSSVTHHQLSCSHKLNEGFLWLSLWFSSSFFFFLAPWPHFVLASHPVKRIWGLIRLTGIELAYLCGPERFASVPPDRTHARINALQTSADLQWIFSLP